MVTRVVHPMVVLVVAALLVQGCGSGGSTVSVSRVSSSPTSPSTTSSTLVASTIPATTEPVTVVPTLPPSTTPPAPPMKTCTNSVTGYRITYPVDLFESAEVGGGSGDAEYRCINFGFDRESMVHPQSNGFFDVSVRVHPDESVEALISQDAETTDHDRTEIQGTIAGMDATIVDSTSPDGVAARSWYFEKSGVSVVITALTGKESAQRSLDVAGVLAGNLAIG